MHTAKGQATMFIMIGLVILLVVSMMIYFSTMNMETSDTLAEIESLEQAATAVEECIDDFMVDSFYEVGMYGGYTGTMAAFSSFETPYELVTIEIMEQNLKIHLERNVRDCDNVLEGTKFEVPSNGKPIADVELGEKVMLSMESIGNVQQINDPGMKQGITSRSEKVNINFIEVYGIVEELTASEYGILVKEYDGYIVNAFMDGGYTEQLVRVYHPDTKFTFRITKEIIGVEHIAQ